MVGSVDQGSGSVPPARATPPAATDGPEADPTDVHGNPKVTLDSDLDGAYRDSVKWHYSDSEARRVMTALEPNDWHRPDDANREREALRQSRLRRWQKQP